MDEDVAELFLQYDWPGNVRELEHVIEGAMNLLIGEEQISWIHLPYHFRHRTQLTPPNHPLPALQEEHAYQARPLKDYLAEAEKLYIQKALERHHGHITNTAQELGLSRQTLQYRMKRLNVAGKKG